ncbi:tetratricopeptide repeat protein [Streptacidiphilus sp. ASG 303]|uniref:tetratricopeptide repeat protein n=1 Tax=Streptacidiphilus sp. ASG 303 TaxID=2896847 RepID=UPI001E3D2CD0|nr:tetratricopeptide repeat protein [Streptacidiphilus sp. ASG 303]MCD0481815.1 tetratricopeptide repeat protein [Streptacidiphilus sp. ASG 303]
MGDGGGRLALVVGCRWRSFGHGQEHITDAAAGLAEVLYDPALGAWSPALPDRPVVEDPGVEELDAALSLAFETAAAARAVLLVAYVGHGVSRNGAFYLVPADHPEDLSVIRARRVVEPRSLLHTLHEGCSGLEGLVLLVDACQSGELVAVDRPALTPGIGRLVVATSTSGARRAAGSAFTRALTTAVRTGVPGAGDHIWPFDIEESLAAACGRQSPQHILRLDRAQDAGLWLAHNRARRAQRLRGAVGTSLPFAELEGLPSLYQYPEGPDPVRATVARHRCTALTGPGGCGKTATLHMLAVDGAWAGGVPEPGREPSAVRAAALYHCSAGSTAEDAAGRMSAQLAHQLAPVPGSPYETARARFAAAADYEERLRMPAFDQLLLGPLRHLSPEVAVTLMLDGLDELPAESRPEAGRALAALADDGAFPHVRVVVTVRSDAGAPDLPDGFATVRIPPATPGRVARYLASAGRSAEGAERISSWSEGNWLLVSLLAGEDAGPVPAERSGHPDLAAVYARYLREVASSDLRGWQSGRAPLLALLGASRAAGGVPVPLLCAASALLGGPGTEAGVREALGPLRRVVRRTGGGARGGAVRLFHSTFAEFLAVRRADAPVPPAASAHWALAGALASLEGMADEDEAVRTYAHANQAHHQWEAGDHHGAVRTLMARPSAIPRQNLETWTAWSRRIGEALGDDHPLALQARQQTAAWHSRCGQYDAARRSYRSLVDDLLAAVGPDDPLTLRTMLDAALCRGVAGDAAGAREALRDLVPRIGAVLGPDHPLSLEGGHALGDWTGLAGAPQQAVRDLAGVLERCTRALGPDHRETLGCRNSLARWTGESGRAAEAVGQFRALLPAQERVLGPDHRETLRTRNNIAYWSGEAGRPAETLALLQGLLSDQERVLGPDHPDTLRTRHGIGVWTGANGDPQEAVRLLEGVLADRVHILGPDHPDTLRTLNNLGRWHGEAGNHAEALERLRDTLERRERTLGPAHPDTLRTRNNLIDTLGASGDAAAALAHSRELLPVQTEVLGAEHPDTLRTGFNEARWTAALGRSDEAAALLRRLVARQAGVLGPDHPETVRARGLLDRLTDGRG